MINQLIFNIIFSTLVFLIIASSITISYNTSKFLNLFLIIEITFSAYFAYFFISKLFFSLVISFFISITILILLRIVIEKTIFHYMRAKGLQPFTLLIASIGIYTFFQNLISLYFGDDPKSIRPSEVKVGHEIFGAYVTEIQIFTMIICTVMFIATLIFLENSNLGKKIRAVSVNSELSSILGINSDKVILWTTVISAILASVAGILIALNVDMTPTFGFNYFIYGVAAMIIGGVNSYKGLVLGALLLASAQNLSAYYIDTKWMDAITYIILISFLVWKPLGFSGQQIKKIEV